MGGNIFNNINEVEKKNNKNRNKINAVAQCAYIIIRQYKRKTSQHRNTKYISIFK